jgi:hypothetical protein
MKREYHLCIARTMSSLLEKVAMKISEGWRPDGKPVPDMMGNIYQKMVKI